MEQSLLRLLEEWKVPANYIKKLEDEEVFSTSTLMCLLDDMVACIFDKVGSRANFLFKLQQLRSECHTFEVSVDDLSHEALHVICEELFLNVKKASGSTLGAPLECIDSTAIETEEVEQHFIEETERCNDNNQQETVNEKIDVTNSSFQPTMDASSSSSQPAPVRDVSRKRPLVSINVLEVDLDSLLKSCLKGKEVLAYYTEHTDLNESYRNKLADVILNQFLKNDHNRRLPSDVENSLTSMIIDFFPTEIKETWMSSTISKREVSLGRGVLIKRYYHIRRALRKSGVIVKGSDNESTNSNFIGDDSDEVKDMLMWLNFNKQPWSQVLEYWKDTAKTRLRTHIDGRQSIEEYLATYVALKDSSGYLLLEADFEVQYSNANSFYTQWPMLAAFIEKFAPPNVLEGIKDCLTPDSRKVKTVHALAHLFSVVTVAKTKNKTYRPSREEVSETLLHVHTVGDIKPTLASCLQKYEPFRLHLSPQAIVVGDGDLIQKSFVRVNEVLYEVENPLKALDVTFKIMHALDAKYHAESKREWLFLERAIYCINVDKTGLNSATANLVRDFNKFKNTDFYLFEMCM